MNIEKSTTTSKSSSAASSHENIEKQRSIIDSIFPFYDQITQKCVSPSLFNYLILCFSCVQSVATSIWEGHSNILGTHAASTQGLMYLISIANFKEVNANDDTRLIRFVAYLVLFVLLALMFVFQQVYYQRRRRYSKQILYPCRMVLELICVLMPVPVASLIGELFLTFFQDNSALKISMFVLMLIIYVLFVVVFLFSFTMFGASPFLGSICFASFDNSPFIKMVLLTSIFQLLSMIIGHFPFWLLHVIVIVHCVCFAFLFYSMTSRPFISMMTNQIIGSTIICCIILDIIRLIAVCFDSFSSQTYGECFIAAVVISIAVNYVFFMVQTKHLKRLMFSDGDFVTLSDDEKRDKLFSLKIDTSLYKTKLVLRYAIAVNSPYIVNLLLVKFIHEIQCSKGIMIEIMKVLCFFPGETRLLNSVNNDFTKVKIMSIKEKFMEMQITRLKYLRQSSSSFASSTKLKELNSVSKEIETRMKYFWHANDISHTYLIECNDTVRMTRTLWDEAILEFPNSSQYSESYTRFLIECSSDFTSAIIQKHRVDLIEGGRNFCIDLCFRQFVHLFPHYLKKEVIDIKGNFIRNKSKNGKNSTNSSNKVSEAIDTSTETSISTLDQAVEEEIGKSLVVHARLRLALQTSLKDRKAKSAKLMEFGLIFIILISLFASFFIFFFYFKYFDERVHMADRIEKSNSIQYYLYISNLCFVFALANDMGEFGYQGGMKEWVELDEANKAVSIINYDIDWRENAYSFSIISRKNYNDFVADVATLSSQHIDVYNLLKPVMQETEDMIYCENGTRMPPTLSNFKTLITYTLLSQSLIAGNSESNTWYTTYDQFCSMESTAEEVGDTFTDIRNSLTKRNTLEYRSFKKAIDLTIYVIAPALAVVTIVTIVVCYVIYYREIRKFTMILLDFNSQVKHQSSRPMLRSEQNEEATDNKADKTSSIDPTIVSLSFIIFFIVLLCAVIEIQLNLSVDSTNEMFQKINVWTSNSRRRKTNLFQMLFYVFQAILITNSTHIPNPKFTTGEKSISLSVEGMDAMDEADSIMIRGIAETPPCINYDAEIDRLTLKERCVADSTSEDYHELYRCGSNLQLYSYFKDLILVISNQYETYRGSLNNITIWNLIHLSLTHFAPTLNEIDQGLADMSDETLASYKSTQIGLFIAELAIILMILCLILYIMMKLNNSFQTLLVFMMRISPIDLISSKELMQYLMNRNSEGNSNSSITAFSIIQKSINPIILANFNCLIEVINPSMTQLLGYTPEQLLGQSITSVIADDDKTKIENQIQLICNKECASTYEDHTTCITDNDTKCPCEITILGMKDSSDNIGSFVVILRDESVLVEKQAIAEEAKKRSESLLYQILPRSIVVRLNQGEKDISFTVPSATIMFIDIVKFSEYASNLSPQEIMSNLSCLFDAYDEAMKRYPLIYKIKLIGDVYMCAGGLFDPDVAPVQHAEQMIKFGLDCISILDETNLKLNALLNVRIGINTGGPLIAGVLGTDKPVFDIIGDPINIASRLQSTDFQGNIQISEDTYELISELDFLVEPRGEVFLKGKGKKNAYLIKPNKGILFQLSNTEVSLVNVQ